MKPFFALLIGILLSFFSIAQSDSASFHFNLGKEYKKAGLFPLASREFQKSIVFNEKYAPAYYENGLVQLEMHQLNNARTNFKKAYELDPSNADNIEKLMQLSYDYRQFSFARQLSLQCKNCKESKKIMAMCDFQTENYAMAIKELTPLTDQYPDDANLLYMVARSYLELEDYKMALLNYKKVIQMSGAKNSWMYELGLICYNAEDFPNAIKYFELAASNGYNSKTSDFIENIGYAYLFGGQFEKGEQILLELIQKTPGGTNIIRDLSNISFKQKRYDKSLLYCQQLLELDGKDAKALYQAGLCFLRMGQKDKGENMCNKAIEMDSSLMSLRSKKFDFGQ